jgi:hypothetical protein
MSVADATVMTVDDEGPVSVRIDAFHGDPIAGFEVGEEVETYWLCSNGSTFACPVEIADAVGERLLMYVRPPRAPGQEASVLHRVAVRDDGFIRCDHTPKVTAAADAITAMLGDDCYEALGIALPRPC